MLIEQLETLLREAGEVLTVRLSIQTLKAIIDKLRHLEAQAKIHKASFAQMHKAYTIIVNGSEPN